MDLETCLSDVACGLSGREHANWLRDLIGRHVSNQKSYFSQIESLKAERGLVVSKLYEIKETRYGTGTDSKEHYIYFYSVVSPDGREIRNCKTDEMEAVFLAEKLNIELLRGRDEPWRCDTCQLWSDDRHWLPPEHPIKQCQYDMRWLPCDYGCSRWERSQS